MLKSNLLCAFIALITAVTISSAFAKGYITNDDGITIVHELKK
jgi:hypothetical protein